MTKSQTAMWAVAAGALITVGVAATAVQSINAASASSSSSASTSGKSTPKPSKSAEATPPPKALSLSGSLHVTGLAPGVSVTRTLNIGNANNQDVELQSVRTQLFGPSPVPTDGDCTSPADVEVFVSGYNVTTGVGAPVTIRKNSNLAVPVTVRMHNSATRNQDSCKGLSWMFTFTATATSK